MIADSDSPKAAEPFSSQPAQLSGCGKPAVIGCLVLLILVGAGLAVLVWKARDLLSFAIDEYHAAVISALPPDLPEEDRRRLDAAFDSALVAIESGDLDPGGLQQLQRSLASPPRPGETLDRESVLELTRALEAVSGASSSELDPGAERARGLAAPLVS